MKLKKKSAGLLAMLDFGARSFSSLWADGKTPIDSCCCCYFLSDVNSSDTVSECRGSIFGFYLWRICSNLLSILQTPCRNQKRQVLWSRHTTNAAESTLKAFVRRERMLLPYYVHTCVQIKRFYHKWTLWCNQSEACSRAFNSALTLTLTQLWTWPYILK